MSQLDHRHPDTHTKHTCTRQQNSDQTNCRHTGADGDIERWSSAGSSQKLTKCGNQDGSRRRLGYHPSYRLDAHYSSQETST